MPATTINRDVDSSFTLFERFLALFFEHLDIVKILDCPKCAGDLNCFFKCDRCDGLGSINSIYLRRWYIYRAKGGRNVYLHKFFRSDDDQDPHDHPWNFTTLVLKGAYIDESYAVRLRLDILPHVAEERRCLKPEKMSMGTLRSREAEHIHQVKLINGKPVWTFIVTGVERRMWGFVDIHGKHIPWREYLHIQDPKYNPDVPSLPVNATSPGGS